MKWERQVGHVLAKDLRHARWGVLLYVILILGVVVQALTQPTSSSSLEPILVLLVGTGLAAFIVQADSPIAANAFWASRPFFPSAVLVSKIVLTLIVVVGLPAVAILSAIYAFDVSAGDAAVLAANAALLFALLLLPVIPIAAMTADLRAFGMSAILTLVAALIGMELWMSTAVRLGWTHHSAFRIGCVAAAVVTVALLLRGLYQHREARARAWAIVFAVASLVIAGWSTPNLHLRDREPNIQRPDLVLGLPGGGYASSSPSIRFRVSATGGSADVSYAVSVDRVTVKLRDGSKFVAAGSSWGDVARSSTLIGGDVRFVGRSDFRDFGEVSMQLTDDENRRLRAGVASYEVDGRVVVVRPQLVADVPFGFSKSLQISGARGRLFDVHADAPGASAGLEMTSLEGGLSNLLYMRSPNEPIVTVVNANARQAIQMHPVGSSAGGGWFVLPGVSLGMTRRQYRTAENTTQLATAGINTSWFEQSRVMVFRPELLGSYPVHLELNGSEASTATAPTLSCDSAARNTSACLPAPTAPAMVRTPR